MMKNANPSEEPLGGTERGRVWRVGTLAYTTGGLVLLFLWLLGGDFAWNLKERAVVPVAQLMLRSFEASDFLVGLLVGSVPAALGMILGPIASVRSDRHRGRFGRRIPFLLIPTPFIVISMVGLGGAPWLADQLHQTLGEDSPGRASIGLLLFIVFWLIFEVATVVANIIFGALINDVVPQELIGRFFGMFRIVGLVAGILFNFTIIGHAETHYFEIFAGIGLFYGLSFLVMCLRVKEGAYPPPEPRPEASLPLASIATYFRECYRHPYYRWLFAAMTFGMLASAPVNSFSVFYAKSVGMSVDTYGKCLALTYGISIALAYPLGAFADRWHPLRLGLITTLLYGGVMIWAGLVTASAPVFAIFLVAHGVLSGAFLTATASIGQRLYPKLKYGQFASAWGLVYGLGFIMTTPLVGLFLDFSGRIYRYTFIASGLLAVLGVVAFFAAWRHFQRLGGVAHYVAPEK